MSKYRSIQLTNTGIGAVAEGGLIPHGLITRKIACESKCTPTFEVSNTNANTVNVQECGTYTVTYSASLTAAAAGAMTVALVINGTAVYSVSETVTTAGDIVNITLPYQIRVLPNSQCCPTNNPVSVQLQITAGGTTAGSGNLIIERVFA